MGVRDGHLTDPIAVGAVSWRAPEEGGRCSGRPATAVYGAIAEFEELPYEPGIG